MPTMQDVAERSGLSRFTVSKVLNGTPGVTQDTRARVMDACRDLNFVTNQHAASLAKGESRLMGLVVTSITDPFYGEIIQTAEHTASALGYDLAYRCSYADADQERRIAQGFLGLKATALIVSAASTQANESFWSSMATHLPVVFIDHSILRSCHLVATDHYRGGRLVTEHLLGKTAHVAYLGSSQPLTNSAIAARQRGYTEAMLAAGQEPVFIPIDVATELSDTERFGYDVLASYLAGTGRRPPRALCCATDSIAVGAMRCLAERGFEPGIDVLVAGHDDLPFSAYSNPSLTTIRQPKREIGDLAVRAAARLTQVKDLRRHPKIKTTLAPELIVRESTLGRRRG
jgi:DNA-binding LacI/PurR family transcriptional regulator